LLEMSDAARHRNHIRSRGGPRISRGIAEGLFVFCLSLPTSLPSGAAEPTFADLLARAQTQADAGRRWEPPGDNLAETTMVLFQLAPTATTQQLAAFSSLLERDRKSMQQVPANAASVAGAPSPKPPSPEPPSAEPVPAPRPVVRLPDSHAADLFARGQAAEQSGDISGARRLYAGAAERGDATAALRLGRLYDPAVLGRTVIGGIDSDTAAARHWYERAAQLGDRQAAPLLQALNAR